MAGGAADKRAVAAVLIIVALLAVLRERAVLGVPPISVASIHTAPARSAQPPLLPRWAPGDPVESACNASGFSRPSRPLLSGTGKRVLVTGVAGFIASHVAAECVKLGMEVVGVDDMSGGFTENIPPGVHFVLGDVKDAAFVAAVFRTRGPFHFVYHLAAYAAEGMSHFVRSYNYRNNLVGSVEVLNEALRTGSKTECFVFTSSIAAYGAATPPIREGDAMHPEDPYGIAKHAFELDLRAAKEMFGLDFVIFRPHNVYGPHQNIADRYRNVIGIFMNQILTGRPMTIFGDGMQTRAFSYIDDVAPIIARGPLLPEARNEAFNVGAEAPHSLKNLATLVAAAMGVPSHPVRHLEKRLEVQNAEATHAKMHCFFNPSAAVELAVGLQRTAAWVRARTKGFRPIEFESVEVRRNMPPSWVRPQLQEVEVVSHTSANNTNFDQTQSAHRSLRRESGGGQTETGTKEPQ